MKKKARVIAFYLPQFHPTPENDKFWGKGFTEWTNVAKAKPLFKGHHQPHIPADLGFYDLRMPEVRDAQAKLARDAGIEGFCYWHYWFGNGKQFLQKIFDEVVESGKPDFPFCVGWANHSWNNKNWVNTPTFSKDYYIAEQTYPGAEDNEKHFYSLLKAFKDPRYIKVDGKLLFYIFAPLKFPNVSAFISQWNELAKK
ncbi:MAG: glycoside hydrolase family 99-like domain-containing protein, partial [Lachnospiraceae bacterium]|nr:glycoside hydrolase family 99-like domain-containing protein [Lachnospiraceae bacterium]